MKPISGIVPFLIELWWFACSRAALTDFGLHSLTNLDVACLAHHLGPILTHVLDGKLHSAPLSERNFRIGPFLIELWWFDWSMAAWTNFDLHSQTNMDVACLAHHQGPFLTSV